MNIDGILEARKKRKMIKEILSFTDFQKTTNSQIGEVIVRCYLNGRGYSFYVPIKNFYKYTWVMAQKPPDSRVTQAYPTVIDLELDRRQPVLGF